MVKTYFFDTSALVKRYITEIGSDWVRTLTDPQSGNRIILARITWIEMLSAYSRLKRESTLDEASFNIALQAFEYDWDTVDGQIFDRELYYNGIREVPMITSHSFRKQYDENGNLFLKWQTPPHTESELSTSARAYTDIYNGSTNTYYFLYVTVPSHLGCLFVPGSVMNMLRDRGNTFNFYVHVRTNDGNNRSYSNEIWLDQIPNVSDCDVNYDGKTGLEEAVHALQITAEIKNP